MELITDASWFMIINCHSRAVNRSIRRTFTVCALWAVWNEAVSYEATIYVTYGVYLPCKSCFTSCWLLFHRVFQTGFTVNRNTLCAPAYRMPSSMVHRRLPQPLATHTAIWHWILQYLANRKNCCTIDVSWNVAMSVGRSAWFQK